MGFSKDLLLVHTRHELTKPLLRLTSGGSAKYAGDKHPELRFDDSPAKNILYFPS